MTIDAVQAAREAEQRVAREVLSALNEYQFTSLCGGEDAVRKVLAKYAPPAPRPSVTLSDGSVVTYCRDHECPWKREYPVGGDVVASGFADWRMLADTGADFDALKAFAAAQERAK